MELPNSNSQVEMKKNSFQNEKVAADDNKPPRPPHEHAEKCPRCDSGNTKFCYYNNYSLSQPRYFCKACRRYWTKGGTLRNVPVGGGCRKNKRTVAKRAFDNRHGHLLVQSGHHPLENVMLNCSTFDPKSHSNFSSPIRYEESGTCDNLSLAFAAMQRQSNVHDLGYEFGTQNSILLHQPITTSGNNTLGFLSNFLEPQTTSGFNKCFQGLYNYGFENGGDQGQSGQHTQPLPECNEDMSFNNMAVSNGFNGDENGNRVLVGIPWQQVENSNNGEVRSLFNGNECNNNNNYSYYNNEGCYEVEGGGERSVKWSNNNNNGLVSAGGSSWPNLINTTALIM